MVLMMQIDVFLTLMLLTMTTKSLHVKSEYWCSVVAVAFWHLVLTMSSFERHWLVVLVVVVVVVVAGSDLVEVMRTSQRRLDCVGSTVRIDRSSEALGSMRMSATATVFVASHSTSMSILEVLMHSSDAEYEACRSRNNNNNNNTGKYEATATR
jgi:hypothetical protein